MTENNKNLKLRIFSAIFYVGFILAGTLINKYLFISLLFVFLGFCLYEMMNILKIESFSSKLITIGLSALVFYLYCSKFLLEQVSYRLELSNILPIVAFLIATITILFYSDELNNDQAKIIFSTIYLAIPFSIAFTIPTILVDNKISYEILLIFVMIWISDSAAYFVGRFFGKRKLAPKISENKTIEGFLGGVVGVIITGYIIENIFHLPIKGNWIALSIVVAITSPIGDLVESKLKRVFEVKDSSNLIPGHGGFLDRLDSFIFCIPFVYVYFIFALKFI